MARALTHVSRLGTLHGEMVDAVLTDGDLERLAALAATEADGTVAIVVPAADLAVAAPAMAPAALELPRDRARFWRWTAPTGVARRAFGQGLGAALRAAVSS